MTGKEPLSNRPYNQPFPTRLRELLKGKRGGQRELAEHLRKTSQAVGYYKDGSTIPDGIVLAKIADFYNVSTDYLLGRTDITTPDITTQAAALRYGLSEETLNTIESLTDNEKWELELLLTSRHLSELLHCIGSCYTSRHNIQGEEAIIRAHQSQYHTLNMMSAHEKDPEKKRALDSLQAEVKRLQKKSMEQVRNAEASSIIRLQRTAVSIGEEVCDKSRKEAPQDGNSNQA